PPSPLPPVPPVKSPPPGENNDTFLAFASITKPRMLPEVGVPMLLVNVVVKCQFNVVGEVMLNPSLAPAGFQSPQTACGSPPEQPLPLMFAYDSAQSEVVPAFVDVRLGFPTATSGVVPSMVH